MSNLYILMFTIVILSVLGPALWLLYQFFSKVAEEEKASFKRNLEDSDELFGDEQEEKDGKFYR